MAGFAEYQDYDGLGLAELIRSKEITPGEVLEAAIARVEAVNSPLKKASLTGFHATAKHIAAKAVSPSSETMRTI